MSESEHTYSARQAARAAGVSVATARNLTPGGRFGELYAGVFSPGAGEQPGGAPRSFTIADVRALAFISQCTASGLTHAQTAARIAGGELAGFDWEPPEEPPAPAPRKRQEEAAPLATVSPEAGAVILQTVAAELGRVMSTQIAEAHARADALAAELRSAESRAAAAEALAGELRAQLEQARRPWYRRLFGG